MDYTARDAIKPRDGFATLEGRRYILVDARYLPDPRGEGKAINAVEETATQVSPGYFPMVLVRVPKNWKRGEEALEVIPNGEYDYFIRVHVSNMRKKLPAGERLVAKRCVGYALVRG